MRHVSEVIEATAFVREPAPQPAPAAAAPVVALAPAHPQPASPLDLPAEVFREGLARRRANRAALMEWVRAALVEGVDFGRIHTAGKNKCSLAAQGRGHECGNPAHWSKPSLFKPGAEKISGMLGVSVHYPSLHDYEQTALSGLEIKSVILRCEIRDAAGRVVADGVGARSLAQDYGDLNKALKMAEKSAHIDATLRMAGLSEVFTQDVEDMQPGGTGQGNGSPGPAGGTGNKAACTQSAGSTKEPDGTATGTSAGATGTEEGEPGSTISEAQRRRLEARIEELGLDRERVKAWVTKSWGVAHFAELTSAQYEGLDKRLRKWAAEGGQ